MENAIQGIHDHAPTDHDWLVRDPKAEHEAEQQRLLSLADLATKALADEGLRELGPISVAPARPGRRTNQIAQLRSQPLEALRGIEFRFDVHRDEVPDSYDAKVSDLIGCARKFLAPTPQLRKAAEKLLARTRNIMFLPNEGGMRVVGLGISNPGGNLYFHVALERLCVDLKPGIDQLCTADLGALERLLQSVPREQQSRLAAARDLRAIGADGWIDEVALRIIDASALPRSKAFALLSGLDTLWFSFKGPSGGGLIAFLFWQNGVVMAELQGDGWCWSCNRLELQNQTLPESILHSLAGRPLRNLVELPVMPRDTPITRAAQSSGTLLIWFETERMPFNVATTRIG